MATMMDQVPKRQPKPGRGFGVSTRTAVSPSDLSSFTGPLVIFLLVSILASCSQSVRFFTLVPESLKPLLGDPPSAQLVSLALAIYFLSMLVINAHGICSGGRPGSLWFHVACRCTFYLLYFIADALPGNLLAVLLAGSVLLALEYLWVRISQRRESWGHC